MSRELVVVKNRCPARMLMRFIDALVHGKLELVEDIKEMEHEPLDMPRFYLSTDAHFKVRVCRHCSSVYAEVK